MNNKISLLGEINRIGKNKIRFFIPMRPIHSFSGFCSFTSSDDPEYLTECYIDEQRYKVEDDYKITLRAVNPLFSWQHFYLCDLERFINNNIAFIAEEGEILEQFWYEEPIGGGFVLKAFATAIIKG